MRDLTLALALLGATCLALVVGIILLALTGQPVPDVLQTLAVGSMTAIGALLARGTTPAPRD